MEQNGNTTDKTISTGNVGAAVHLMLCGHELLAIRPLENKAQFSSFTFPVAAAQPLAEYLEAHKELFHRMRRTARWSEVGR